MEVHGRVKLFFEDFSLDSSDCGAYRRGIWLAYGGDEPTPTPSTANDTRREPGSVLQVEGRPVPLIRDANLDLLKRRLAAKRHTTPDGFPCYDKCPFYRVSATLYGLFMAAPEGTDTPMAGYGHFGCCHLLSIQKVSDIETARTEIPAGGKYACSTETWDMDRKDAHQAFDDYTCVDESACLRPIQLLARHWVDDTDLTKFSELNHELYAPLWRSADLLTTYRLEKVSGNDGVLVGAMGRRTRCTAVEPPYPAATPIGCRELEISDEFGAKQTNWHGEPTAVAWRAFDQAVRIWGIQPLAGLSLQGCSEPREIEGRQFSTCGFIDATSMQNFTIDLNRIKPKRFRGWGKVPWSLGQSYGTACAPE